jgi:hypothetical protein
MNQLIQMFAFIPFIQSTMNSNDLIKTFDQLELGKIHQIYMHRKVNERNQEYQFAFVEVEPYNTLGGLRIAENLSNNISTRVSYDAESQHMYLEIKPYLSYHERTTIQSLCRELLEIRIHEHLCQHEESSIVVQRNYTAFDSINEEYDAVQMEIRNLMAAPVYSIWTTPLLFVQ